MAAFNAHTPACQTWTRPRTEWQSLSARILLIGQNLAEEQGIENHGFHQGTGGHLAVISDSDSEPETTRQTRPDSSPFFDRGTRARSAMKIRRSTLLPPLRRTMSSAQERGLRPIAGGTNGTVVDVTGCGTNNDEGEGRGTFRAPRLSRSSPVEPGSRPVMIGGGRRRDYYHQQQRRFCEEDRNNNSDVDRDPSAIDGCAHITTTDGMPVRNSVVVSGYRSGIIRQNGEIPPAPPSRLLHQRPYSLPGDLVDDDAGVHHDHQHQNQQRRHHSRMRIVRGQNATDDVNLNSNSNVVEDGSVAGRSAVAAGPITRVDSNVLNAELLPDILNSHLPPPPYSTLPHNTEHSASRREQPTIAAAVPGGVQYGNSNQPVDGVEPPPVTSQSVVVATARTRRSRVERFSSSSSRRNNNNNNNNNNNRSTPRGSHYTPEDEPKHCCGVTVTQTVSIRWFIVMIAFVGLCCAVVGTVLGALKATGREHLTVSLLMIGVGIVLITVSGIAWKLTSHDAPSCRAMLGLNSDNPEPNRRFVPRVPPAYGRPHHPYAAMMYPEFHYRPPPPSYQASMQEYRLRLLLLDRQPAPNPSPLSPLSPPPTYRSHNGTITRTTSRPPLSISRDSDCSRPPSYRSRASSVHHYSTAPTEARGTVVTNRAVVPPVYTHSRDPSLSLSVLSRESLFDANTNTASEAGSPQRATIPWDPCPVSVASGDPVAPVTCKRPRDTNTVTILQTTEASRVLEAGGDEDLSPQSPQGHQQREVEILAHL